MEKESDIVISQRIRNHLIEHLEHACSEEKLLEYQENVPIARVPIELIEQWSDSFDMDGYVKGWYSPPTYTEEELQAALAFEAIINYACKNLPNITYDINEIFKMPWWPLFKKQAKITLSVFMKRGKLSNDTEELNK